MSIDTREAFEAASAAHRRELHVHCYRMLASYEDAEDAVQETFLRAWRERAQDGEVANLRAWLYRVSTNVCLDLIRAKGRRADALGDVSWLEPYPDDLLDAAAAEGADSVAIARETVHLTFLAVIQLLPPSQRAALVLRDVIGWPVRDIADVLRLSAGAVNSLLQRARATLRRHLPSHRRISWPVPNASNTERVTLNGFIAAHESGNIEAALQLIADDIRVTMPPNPLRFDGVDEMRILLARAAAFGTWRLVPIQTNRQLAAASYVRRSDTAGDRFDAYKIDVLDIRATKIVGITTFGVKHFAKFGLPLRLDMTQDGAIE